MINPLVSIIIPIYNSDKFLYDSLSSVINQTYKNIEIILINDGSTDNCHLIISSFLQYDKRIIYINRKKNEGLVYSLNEALLISKGIFIARMDADDISIIDRIEKQIHFFNNNLDVHLIGTAYNVINNKNEFIKCAFHPKDSLTLFLSMSFNTYFCHPSVMFKKDLVFNIGFYNPVEAEDYDFFSRIVLHFKSANLPAPLIYYRNHLENRSNKNAFSIFESRLKISSNYFETLGFDLEKSFLSRLLLNSDKRQVFSFLELFRIMNIFYKIYRIACSKYDLNFFFNLYIFIKFFYKYFFYSIKNRIKHILFHA